MSEEFKPIDFSKYAELGDLYRNRLTDESGESMRRYGELSQQLADELGGGDRAVEAMLALGAVNREDLDITSGATNYEEIMDRRKQFLSQGRSVEEADAIEPFRLAAILTGERQPDLNYVQADRARRYYSQYGTPEQIDYTNQLATQLRSAQPQGMMSQLAQPRQPINMYSTTSKYFAPELESIQLSGIKNYLNSLDGTGYLSLLSKMFNS